MKKILITLSILVLSVSTFANEWVTIAASEDGSVRVEKLSGEPDIYGRSQTQLVIQDSNLLEEMMNNGALNEDMIGNNGQEAVIPVSAYHENVYYRASFNRDGGFLVYSVSISYEQRSMALRVGFDSTNPNPYAVTPFFFKKLNNIRF